MTQQNGHPTDEERAQFARRYYDNLKDAYLETRSLGMAEDTDDDPDTAANDYAYDHLGPHLTAYLD